MLIIVHARLRWTTGLSFLHKAPKRRVSRRGVLSLWVVVGRQQFVRRRSAKLRAYWCTHRRCMRFCGSIRCTYRIQAIKLRQVSTRGKRLTFACHNFFLLVLNVRSPFTAFHDWRFGRFRASRPSILRPLSFCALILVPILFRCVRNRISGRSMLVALRPHDQ